MRRLTAVILLAYFCLQACGPTPPVPVQTAAPAASATPQNTPPNTPPQPVKPSPTPENAPIRFEKTFGGSRIDQGIGVNQTRDGGFIITGFTTLEGRADQDVFLIRTGPDGALTWSQTFGGEQEDNGWGVLETEDGGFILAGFTESFGAGGTDAYVIRTDASGRALWERTYGGPRDDIAWSIIPAAGGGYLLAGETTSMGNGETDAYFIRIDSDGNLLWENSYGGERLDRVFSVLQDEEGSFVAAGVSNSFDGTDRDAYIIKTDAGGGLLWEKLFGEDEDDVAHSVHPAGDGSYFVTGYTRSFGASDYDALVIALDWDGEILFQNVFGGRLDDRLITGSATADGGAVLVGYTKSFGAGSWDIYLVRVNASGAEQWFRAIGAEGEDTGYSVRQTRNGGYVLVGYTRSSGAGARDVYLVRVSGP